jgi:hypothetical protein
MEPSSDRRAEPKSGVGFTTSGSVLAVGARTAVLDDVFDRSQVLHTYFDLVAEQRSGPLAVRADLRDRDLVSLAAILDLPPVDLERYIDRELARFVASTAAEATPVVDLTASTPTAKKQRVRPLILVIGAVTIAGAAVAANRAAHLNSAPAAQLVPAETPTTLPSAGTVGVEAGPDGTGKIVIIESAPAPVAADGSEIGTAVRIYREP